MGRRLQAIIGKLKVALLIAGITLALSGMIVIGSINTEPTTTHEQHYLAIVESPNGDAVQVPLTVKYEGNDDLSSMDKMDRTASCAIDKIKTLNKNYNSSDLNTSMINNTISDCGTDDIAVMVNPSIDEV